MSELLIETLNPQDVNLITEAKMDASGAKKYYLEGIYMQADIKNRNGRNYPLSEISKAVTNAAACIQMHGGIFGELDHPQTLTINMDRVSHVIREMRMDGQNAVAKSELLDTPMGKIAQTLAESGVRYGVSSRGTGDVNDRGVVENFNFVTADLVVTPSAPGAMPKPIYENLQQDIKGRQVLTLAEAVQHDETAQKYLRDALLKEFSKMLK